MHVIPVVVWMCALGAVVFLFDQRQERFEVVGIVRGVVSNVTVNREGMLKSLVADEFENVKKGQVIAVLDDSEIQALINTSLAQIKYLTAGLVPLQEQMQTDSEERQSKWNSDKRQFQNDIEQAGLLIMELKTTIETDQKLLEELSMEERILQQLVDTEAIATYELEKAQIQRQAMETKIAETKLQLAAAKQNLEMANHRAESFMSKNIVQPSIDNALDQVRKEIAVEEQRIQEYLAQKQNFVMISPIDGVVTRIFKKEGETVVKGEVLMEIHQTAPESIVVYTDETKLFNVEQGRQVRIFKGGTTQKIGISQVAKVGESMQLMEERLWADPQRPQWGKPIIIEIPQGLNLIPGEFVGVKDL